ncbi:hypothetical protein R1sor_000202 [Riccia sorocarpa]|uniref:Uncharacterized protein n=1 Tax=Riccia sorocarpa TaxID=122646 RepID=A0ABD3GVN8_9MARC
MYAGEALTSGRRVVKDPSKRNWDGIQNDPNYVSAYEACLRIKGTSELSKLYLASFEHRQVDHLPEDYDGNVNFELPPSTQADLSKKGGGHVGMDRAYDCWLWTKSVTTSARIGGKKSLYAVNKIRCVGSLKCVNECCPYFISEGQANRIDWPDKVHCDKPYQEGSLLPYKYHVCGHCASPPLCDMTCPAQMYYVIPKGKVDIEEVEKMSRVAIHIGNHIHPQRRICSRRNFNNVKEEVAETLHASPHFTPGQVRAAASQERLLHMELENGFLEERVKLLEEEGRKYRLRIDELRAELRETTDELLQYKNRVAEYSTDIREQLEANDAARAKIRSLIEENKALRRQINENDQPGH